MKRIFTMLLMLSMLALLGMTGLGPALAADDFTWSAAESTQITFNGAEVSITGNGATQDAGKVIIDAAGTYVLSGTWTDGQVHIAATNKDTVRIVLNGVTIDSSTSAPLYASQADEVTLILADGTENMLRDAATYQYAEGEDEPDAALFIKDDLTIGGSGTLTVQGNYRHGIATKDDLTISDGALIVTAVHDGIRGKDSVTITGGSFNITAGNDGIKANNDSDTEKGWIRISGGDINLTAEHDGIQAETSLHLEGGSIAIVAGGGAKNAEPRAQETFGRGGNPAQTGQTQTEASDTDDADSTSYKGLKSQTLLEITGGTLTIDAADDALHTNGDMTLSGGALTITTGDDGAHADGNLTISGGTLLIAESYEGLEGATVTVTGGDIHLTASDDGINAAGGSDGEGGLWGADTFRSGGSDQYSLDIQGGTLWVHAGGDGLDSNGSLTISGGDITIHGPTASGNSALDADGGITVTGGSITFGSSAGMLEMPGASSTQTYLAVSYANSIAAGTNVTLSDAQGNTLATYTAEKDYPMVFFSIPALTTGETYTVTTSTGITTTVTLSSLQTMVSDTGEAVSGGGRGGFGGGMRGGDGAFPGGGRQQQLQGDQPAQPPEGMEGMAPPEGMPPSGAPDAAPDQP